MSAADKTKLDGVAASAENLQQIFLTPHDALWHACSSACVQEEHVIV
jgi:hypothetical protein